jgi:polar amino acid transport system substrate-binding protein
MKIKLTSLVISAVVVLSMSTALATATAAAIPKPGDTCAKAGSSAKYASTTLKCKLVWVADGSINPALYNALPASIKAKGLITFVTDPTDPPMQLFDKNNILVGAEVDLVKALGLILGVKVKFVTANFDTIIPGIEAGRYDASVSAFADRVGRQKVVDFVDYFTSSRAYLFKTGTHPGLQTATDLCGLNVAVAKGTTMADSIVTQSAACVAAGKAAIGNQIYPDQSACVLAVQSGRADMTILSDHVALWIASTAGGNLDVLLKPKEANDINGMVVKKGGLVRTMQKAVQQLMDNGTFRKIFTKWGVQKLMLTTATVNAGVN